MKIAKRDIAILMVIVGIIAAFCSYKFYFSGKLEEVEQENNTQADLQRQIDEVAAVAATDTEMNNQVTAWAKEVDKIIEKYRVSYKFEDGILYLKNAEEKLDVVIDSYTIGESAVANSIDGLGTFSGKYFNQGITTYSFSYSVKDYDALKKLIDYLVSGNEGVKTLDAMTFAVLPTGETSGTVTLSVYSLSDGSVEYELPNISGVDLKVDNIFGPVIEEEAVTPQ